MWCRASVVLGVVLCVVLGVVLGVSKVWCRRVPCRLHHTHYATLTAPHIPAPSHCTTLHYTLHHAQYTTVALHHPHSLPSLSQIPPSAEWRDARWHASEHSKGSPSIHVLCACCGGVAETYLNLNINLA